ncbi:hypothetical protein KK083_23435 [Fulvivirgaceae bacterium PWU4]|uniref:Uncharacterized protein n=1 Tax=Chryseosolibacter histidini TaxID=2782349 RepID=A0AAP2DP08_9BACT|nr:hypothetical protein [Chryseosolibacter histidini]MBT1699860.1 hypothetical protein [Chryseosolibacter histidini]
MKKLLLVICTAALFCLAGVVNAQQQDQRSNQYRNTQNQNQQRTDTTDGNNDRNMVQDQSSQPQSDVEVVENKEGPNSEVVYKFQGELFYVDRDEKKLVKAEESELKDATHETIVKDAMAQDNSTKDSSTKKDKSSQKRDRDDQ